MDLTSLANRFFLFRHGHSQANEQDLIVSNQQDGIRNYGLSEKGIKQIITAIVTARENGLNLRDPLHSTISDVTDAFLPGRDAGDIHMCELVLQISYTHETSL